MFCVIKGGVIKNIEVLVYAPIDGEVKDLSTVADEVFANKIIGDGYAIIPTGNYVFSPIKGRVVTAFRTGHAFGINSKKGPAILVHIGLDTVELEGKGFIRLITEKDKVKPKTKLARVDWDVIKKANKISDVLIIATNDTMNDWKIVPVAADKQQVKVGDLLFKIIKSNENK